MERNPHRSVMAIFISVMIAAAAGGAGQTASSPQRRPSPPPSVRMYVLDCGTLHIADPGRFGLKAEEVAVRDMSVACYLVAHPRGTLLWDAGAVPERQPSITKAT